MSDFVETEFFSEEKEERTGKREGERERARAQKRESISLASHAR
jgi:hypothetical protein